MSRESIRKLSIGFFERSKLGFVARSEATDERWGVAANLRRLEIERQFACGGFFTIGRMNQVHLAGARKITSNRARGRLQSVGRAQHLAYDANGFEPLDGHRNDR